MPELTRVCFVLIASLVLIPHNAARAAEAGMDYYVPGVYGNFGMAELPGEGFYYLNYSIYMDGNADKYVRTGEVREGISEKVFANAFVPVWLTDKKIFGGDYAFGLAMVWGGADITVTSTGSPSGSERLQDTNWGLFDASLLPWALSWKELGDEKKLDLFAYQTVNVPIGEYNDENLATLGMNYWAFDQNLSATYRATDRWELNGNIGFTVNMENEDTDYQTGSAVHFDGTLQYNVSSRLQLGLSAYAYTQVQGDSGDGATLGNFKGDAWGMGPSFQYVVSKKPISIINFEWVSDVYTNNRVDWDTFVLFWAMEF